jgi:hypothetical protein
MYALPEIFGLHCQRVDKEENGKSLIKILLTEKGRSNAFTLPFLSKVYLDPVAQGEQVSVNQIPCNIIPENHKNYLYALPAVKATLKEQGGTVEKVRIQCLIPNAIPIANVNHPHFLPANSLVYFQAVGTGRPIVVVIEKIDLDDLHLLSVRSSISESEQFWVSWRIGQESDSVFLSPPEYQKLS